MAVSCAPKAGKSDITCKTEGERRRERGGERTRNCEGERESERAREREHQQNKSPFQFSKNPFQSQQVAAATTSLPASEQYLLCGGSGWVREWVTERVCERVFVRARVRARANERENARACV